MTVLLRNQYFLLALVLMESRYNDCFIKEPVFSTCFGVDGESSSNDCFIKEPVFSSCFGVDGERMYMIFFVIFCHVKIKELFNVLAF